MLEEKYAPHAIEEKWQKYWDENKSFKVEMDENKPKHTEVSYASPTRLFSEQAPDRLPAGGGLLCAVGQRRAGDQDRLRAVFHRRNRYVDHHPLRRTAVCAGGGAGDSVCQPASAQG